MYKNRHRIKWKSIGGFLGLLGIQLFFFLSTALAQNTVSGTITDAETGETLPGVNVMVKGTTIGAASDSEGAYSLNVPSLSDTLIFSFVGYQAQEVPIEGRANIDISLAMQAIMGSDVLVVGYGTQEKATSTGSISAVKGDEIEKAPAANTTNLLQGRMPGLVAVTPTGEPGNDNSTLRIRGVSTLGNNSPLIVVDGIPNRSLSRIDPSTIEDITILKDASAAIYGSQAANGVILVTTKRGTEGKPQIKINIDQGWNTPTVLPDMADAASYAQMINEIKMYNGEPAKYTQEDIKKYRTGSNPWTHPSTDWFDAVIKPWSPQRNADISLSGGSDRIQYFTNLGYNYQDGIFYNSATNYSQLNLRSNLDANVTDNIEVSLNVTARQEDRNYPGKRGMGALDTWWALNRQYPYLPAYWPTGEPGPDVEYGQNPVLTTTNATGYYNRKTYILQSNLRFDVTVPWVEGLSLTLNANADKEINNNKQFTKPWYVFTWDGQTRDENGTPVLVKGKRGVPEPRLSQSMSDGTRTLLKALANYETNIGEKNNVEALLGWERIEGNSMYVGAYRRYFNSTAIDEIFAGGDRQKDNWGAASKEARMSYFGRFNYNYDSKYLVELLFRYDGSYIFPEDSRWGFFPGVSLGWQISEEDFYKENISLVNYLKIRGSWGETGNDRIAPYQYLETYGYSGTYVFNGNEPSKTLRQLRTPNPNITWEVSTKRNIGFDAELFDGSVTITADYFNNLRSNILWWRNASVPQSTGLSLPQENIAKVANSGYEVQVGYRNQTGDFSYAISVNGTHTQNEIKFWDEPPGAPEYQKSTGHPIGSRLYYKAIGVFNDQEDVDSYPHWPNARPGDIIFKDVNDDGIINGLDRIRTDKTDIPTFQGGLNIDLGYKGFDASILIQGAAGGARAFREFSGEAGNFRMDNFEGRWTPDNRDASKPRTWNRSKEYWMTDGAPNNTYWVRDTDYMRLKSVNIGYTLPPKFSERLSIGSLRVYVSGLNLYTITGLEDFDPESPSRSPSSIWVNSQVYPLNKTYNLGVSLTF